MKKIILLFSFFTFISQTGFTSDKTKLIPREKFFKGVEYSNIQTDATASYVYFLSSAHDTSVHYVSVKSPSKKHSIGPGKPILFYYCHDKDLIIVYKDTVDQIAQFSRKGLIKKAEIPSGIKEIKFIRKGAPFKSQIALKILFENSSMNGVYVFDMKSFLLTKKHDMHGMADIFLDGKLNMKAAQKINDKGGMDLFTYAKGKWELLMSHPYSEDMNLGSFSKILTVSDDGFRIYFTSNLSEDKTKLYILDREKNQIRELASNEKADILPFGFSQNMFSEITSVVSVAAKSIRTSVYKDWGADFKALETLIKGDISFVQSTESDKKWILREFTGGPSKIWHYDRSTQELKFLFTEYPTLEKDDLATRRAYKIKSFDGLELPLHVYLPPGSDKNGDGIPDKPLPTILYVHGGPWVGVVHWNQYFHWRNFQLLANRGYAVINCEFRGSTGLGKEFCKAGYKEWGNNMLKDKVAIADWAVNSGISQAQNLGVWGWSYGGYASLSLLALHPDKFACGLAMYGISDLESFGKFSYADNDFWKERVGDTYNPADAKMLKAYSALFNIDKIKSPLLLTTGSKDERVPQSQFDIMADAMLNKNKECIYFYYPDEVHDYRDPDSWVSYWAIAEKFLSDKLGGKAEQGGKEKGKFTIVSGKEYIESIP